MIKREKRSEVFCERCDELIDRGALITINEDKKTFCFGCLNHHLIPWWPGDGWTERYKLALEAVHAIREAGTPLPGL